MTSKRKHLLTIGSILFLAAALRLVNLSAGDPLGDEVLYAFRSVGPMDFDAAAKQSTPWEWFDPNIPWWARASFHDHPPLVFWVQHFFIKILGENNFAFRLPSALFGVASVYLVYLIGQQLFTKEAGLTASLLLAVTVNHVFVSRVGLQESYVIFFALLSLLLFVKSMDDRKYLVFTGAAVGLGGLAKCTTFVTAPIILTALLLFKRTYFKEKYFWLGILTALIIFSPVIIYNVGLYGRAGHFDFQFSYIFGQHPEVWQTAPGKEEFISIGEKARYFLPNLADSNSGLLLAFFVLNWPIVFRRRDQSSVFVLLWLCFQILLLGFIGPATRFLTMLTPIMVLSAGSLLNRLRTASSKMGLAILIPVVSFEIFYSANGQLLNYPMGRGEWLFSKVRYENYNWGYNDLDKFLERELEGRFPKYIFDSKYGFIQKAQTKSLEKAKKEGSESYAALLIYDQNIYNTAQLWIFDLRQIYRGWPALKTEDYFALLNKNVFTANYFIVPTDKIPLKRALTSAGQLLELDLTARGIKPIGLKNGLGEETFRVYKF